MTRVWAKIRWLPALCAVLAAALLPAQAGEHLYILTGQSNSLGAVKGSPATPEQLARYASQAKLWNGNMVRDTGELFDKSPSWQTVAPQLPSYRNLCMGPEYGFAHMMQRRGWHAAEGESIFIIKASLDGGGNSFWLPGAPAWKSLVRTVDAALGALPGEPQVHALLYLQGESDKGEEISLAPARLLDLLSRLKKKLRNKQALRYAVVGECATWAGKEAQDARGATSAGLMGAMADKRKEVGWVRTRDLTKITSGDAMGVHYDGASQLSIGARYAYATALLEKLPLGCCARSDRPAAPLNTPAAWWGGKLPGADEAATWDISAANVADTLSGSLALGGIVVEDPFRGGVSVAPVAGKKARLLLGAKGLCLKEGDLEILCAVEIKAPQRWQVAAGHKLALGSAAEPVELTGHGRVELAGAAEAEVELHLAAPPAVEWRLGSPAPRVRATIGGRPARMLPQGKGYKLAPAE